jgi:hypothetical protein
MSDRIVPSVVDGFDSAAANGSIDDSIDRRAI